MIKARNNRYNVNVNYDDETVPDFERQLTINFNLKYKRADELGVRNLIIDNNNLIRASRPNMDKLVKVENMKHEIRNFSKDLFDEESDKISQRKSQGIFLQFSRNIKLI